MKSHINKTTDVIYYIAYNEDKSIIHVGELSTNRQVSTGQPYLEIYNTIEDLRTAHGDQVIDLLNNNEDSIDFEETE
jgi:hypothetical protein